MDSHIIHGFARLFRGRLDAYGDEEGGCIRPEQQGEAMWLDVVADHLNGIAPIGAYPMVTDDSGSWVVRWGCVDFDEGDSISWIHALNLHLLLAELGVTAWIERSRSKGYHVWVFSSDWVPAASMRRALLGATQMAQAPIKEINPKQEQLGLTADGKEKIGNYVRLPYPGWLTDEPPSTTRRVILSRDGIVYPLELFVEDALATRTTSQQIVNLEKYWEPPARTQHSPAFVNVNAAEVGTELPPAHWMGRTANAVFRYGPFEGGDRSSALWKLGCNLRKDGYGPDEVLAFVIDADRRWGKHVARGDLATLERMVVKVFST